MVNPRKIFDMQTMFSTDNVEQNPNILSVNRQDSSSNEDTSVTNSQLSSNSKLTCMNSGVVSAKLYDTLVEELRCPGCTKAMRAPILLCETGHSICELCTKIFINCPLCEVSKVI